jgi:kinetochore protein Nuf2
MAAHFSFPVLSFDVIIGKLSELQFSVSKEDLAKPKPELVQRLYEHLGESIVEMRKDELYQPKFAGLSVLEFPELHEGSIPTLAVFSELSKMFQIVGINDFRLEDLLKPQAKRLRNQLSAVINFGSFRDETCISFRELDAQTEYLLEARLKLQQEADALDETKRKIKAIRDEDAPRVAELEKETEVLENTIKERNKEQAQLKFKGNELKAENKEIRDKIAEIRFICLSEEKKCEDIEGQIVNSPERRKAELNHMAEPIL